jgi:hypothetical protein
MIKGGELLCHALLYFLVPLLSELICRYYDFVAKGPLQVEINLMLFTGV